MKLAKRSSIYRGQIILAGQPLPSALQPKPVPAISAAAQPIITYGAMTLAELNKLVEEHGLTIEEGTGSGGAVVKADLVRALEQYATGLTES